MAFAPGYTAWKIFCDYNIYITTVLESNVSKGKKSSTDLGTAFTASILNIGINSKPNVHSSI